MVRILLLLLCCCYVAYSQDTDAIVQQKVELARKKYRVAEDNEFLISVPYVKSYVAIQGDPFWSPRKGSICPWLEADVEFKGRFYPLKMLKYDCLNNVMVTVSYTANGQEYSALVDGIYGEIRFKEKNGGSGYYERVDGKYQEVEQLRRFVYHSASTKENANDVGSGYYEVVLDSTYSLWVKHIKFVKEQSGTKRFFDKEEFFIKSPNRLYKVRRVQNLYEDFPGKERIIEQFVQDNTVNKLLPLSGAEARKLTMLFNSAKATEHED